MTFAVFASIVFIHLMAAISPGPSFVVAVRTAASEGFRVAASLAVGFGLGAVIWALAALFGLAVLFQIAPWLFTTLKIVGAAFLIWIAIMTWRHASDPLPEVTEGATPRSALSALRLGVITQLANPKPAVFFGAVFVGLVPPDVGWQALILLLVVIFANETLWYMLVGQLFSTRHVRAVYARGKRWVDRAFGGLIAAFGVKIAVT